MASIRYWPALLTPPPIINACGFTTVAILAMAFPRYVLICSTTATAPLSPSFAKSKTSFAVMSSPNSVILVDSLFFAIYLFASLTTPVADAYCSRHPQPPQLQLSSSPSSTCM